MQYWLHVRTNVTALLCMLVHADNFVPCKSMLYVCACYNMLIDVITCSYTCAHSSWMFCSLSSCCSLCSTDSSSNLALDKLSMTNRIFKFMFMFGQNWQLFVSARSDSKCCLTCFNNHFWRNQEMQKSVFLFDRHLLILPLLLNLMRSVLKQNPKRQHSFL